MKLYIMTDMEGVGGVVLSRQANFGEPWYEHARKLLTAEVNAAIEGAQAAGATEILVLDGHGTGYNLIIDELNEDIKFIVGAPWSRFLEGLDETFAAMFLIGFHPRSGTERGVLDHTMTTAWLNVYLNDLKVGELGLSAAYAGEFSVPTVLVTGDLAVCQEAKELLGPEIEVVAVKEGVSRTSAICIHPHKVHKLIKQAAQIALAKADKIKPVRIKGPVEFKIEFAGTEPAQAYIGKPGIERVDSRTVVFRGKNVREAIDYWYGKTR